MRTIRQVVKKQAAPARKQPKRDPASTMGRAKELPSLVGWKLSGGVERAQWCPPSRSSFAILILYFSKSTAYRRMISTRALCALAPPRFA